jgi:hypothetical protein
MRVSAIITGFVPAFDLTVAPDFHALRVFSTQC